MKKFDEIEITLTENSFGLSFSVMDEDLLDVVMDALEEYVKRGFPIKLRQTYMTSPSDSVKMIIKLISKMSQMEEWRGEIKQLIRVLKKQALIE